MASTTEIAAPVEVEAAPAGPLTDWQRRRILITAAASAVAGAPVRILDIRIVNHSPRPWTRKGLGRKPPVRPVAWQRAWTRPAAAPGPEPQEVETIS